MKTFLQKLLAASLVLFLFGVLGCPAPTPDKNQVPTTVGTFQFQQFIALTSANPPTGLEVSLVAEKIQVNWNQNTEPDLLGYMVHWTKMRNASDTLLLPFKRDAGKVNKFTLSNLSAGSYALAVSAYDTAYNFSKYSKRVFFIVHATFDTVAIDSLFDSFSQAEPLHWTPANNSQNLMQYANGMMSMYSLPNESGWLVSRFPFLVKDHYFYFKATGSKDFCIGLSDQVNLSAPNGFWMNTRTIRFYNANFSDIENALYYLERNNQITTRTIVGVVSSRFKKEWVHFLIKFHGTDSLSWDYSFDGMNWMSVVAKTKHNFAGTPKLYLEIAAEKTPTYGNPKVDEFFWKNSKPLAPPVDTINVKIPGFAKDIFLYVEKVFQDTLGRKIDSLAIRFTVGIRKQGSDQELKLENFDNTPLADDNYKLPLAPLRALGLGTADTLCIYASQVNLANGKNGKAKMLKEKLIF